jgi:Amt family ammonium transporter
MAGMGALDFAGGTVVHISSGISALAAAIFIGKRKGYGTTAFIPHNLPMTLTGAGLLWFGWFGFNAGSALASNGLAANAFVVTHLASAAAAVSWVIFEWIHRGKPTTLGVASGAVAGLVAITPASGFVGPMSSIIIGFMGGALCYGGVLLKARLGYDDALDVVGIHGVGGTWGALATGLFASTEINSAGANGLFFGNAAQLWTQFVSVAATMVFAFVMTCIILKFVDMIMGLRVSEEEEIRGMDTSVHNEAGYSY